MTDDDRGELVTIVNLGAIVGFGMHVVQGMLFI